MPERLPLLSWWTLFGNTIDGAAINADESRWKKVEIPHNWDDYHGYHFVAHGNLHGSAWYRTHFSWNPDPEAGNRLYAFFEGVGSYADIYCNGIRVGDHAGGKTSFTVDLTAALQPGENVLAVCARHPEKITDLPFVCGGCWGSPNTEGSQPFGIFRPVWLERTGPVRVDPFGVYVVTLNITKASARAEVFTELSNPSPDLQTGRLHTSIIAPDGSTVCELEDEFAIPPGSKAKLSRRTPRIQNPQLWGPGHPHLYRALTTVSVNGTPSHRMETAFGLRWLKWPTILQDGKPEAQPVPDAASETETVELAKTPLPKIQYRHEEARIRLTNSQIQLHEASLPGTASLAVELDFNGIPGTAANLFCEIQNQDGTVFFHQSRAQVVVAERALKYKWNVPKVHSPRLWTQADPYLHRVNIELRSPEDGALWERSEVFFGIRQKQGALNLLPPHVNPPQQNAVANGQHPAGEKVLKINGEPLFLNGTAEYENLLGCDHAFTDEQIAADVAMMMSAGFNAFRDAHHPHNLRYYDHWDRLGVVCWTQMTSHIWFDTPEFRANYKRLVAEWVRERRNHPSVILWGLQNESAMPEDFVRELREIIRELDPTSPVWRPTTTCNGGAGSDWDVPQDWCGTYGGNCNDYDLEMRQLVGEYGAWRDFGVHRETDYHGDENDRSETWACYAMETKIRLGEAARHRAIGHFHWIFNTFQNPGRSADNCEGPGNAGIGSVNNKGLMTAWHQPSDLYYLFRSNYADPTKQPMVYIVSHTWADRWKQEGPRRVSVFSNCQEVELFNGVNTRSLGKKIHPGKGLHFVWEAVDPQTNVLYAVGRQNGRDVAVDLIKLQHLPCDETLDQWLTPVQTAPAELGKILYRVSCGSTDDITDREGRIWLADKPWGSGADWGWVSWGNRFDNVADDLASRGDTSTPVRGAYCPELFETYRFGRHDLKYHFAVTPGIYRLRLHFTEPWFGVGGGGSCKGWRLFDIAVNETVIERDLDVWSASGGDHRALARDYEVEAMGTRLTLHFPKVRVGQALICGIEIYGRGAT